MSKAKRKILVTGAAGFLGGTVCRQLVERGDDVRAFVLPNDPAMKFVPAEAEVCAGDLCDKKSLEKFFTVEEGVETIVLHIASIVSVNPEYNQKVIDVNVGGTQNIIDLCLSHPECKKLVYCSSTGAIPELPEGEAIKEISKFNPDKVLGCYSQSKAIATQKVLDAVRDQGLNACVVHPSGIMGPEDFAVGETTGTLIKIINGEIPSKKVYEDDDVLAILDISQATLGHTLVLPKKHYANILEIPTDEYQKVMKKVKELAEKINKNLKPAGINILNNCGEAAGQTVMHYHVHILPRYTNNDLKIEFTDNSSNADLDAVLKKINN